MSGMRRRAWVVVVSVVAVGVLFVTVFPTRTWLAQHRDLADTERRVHVLATENAQLEDRVARLSTDAEIERLAREQYHLVRPGEEALAVLPAPPAPRRAAREAPERHEPGLLSRVWDDVTFWD